MKWAYLCYNLSLTWTENLNVRFKMFYLTWLLYFFGNDTWHAKTVLQRQLQQQNRLSLHSGSATLPHRGKEEVSI